MTISNIAVSSTTSSFRGDRRCLKFPTHWVHKGNWSLPLVAMLFDGSNSFGFCRRSSSDLFYQIILNSDHPFQRRY